MCIRDSFGVYCEAEFNLDKSQKILEVTLSNTKLGMLPIPDSMLGDILKKTFADKIKCKKNMLQLPVSLETTVEGIDLKVSLEEFIPEEGSVTLKSNKILADTLDSASDKAKEWIIEHKKQLREYGDDMAPVSYTHLDVYKRQAMTTRITGFSVCV